MTLGAMRPYSSSSLHGFDHPPRPPPGARRARARARRAPRLSSPASSARRSPATAGAGAATGDAPPGPHGHRTGSAGSRGWRAIAGIAGRRVAVRPSLAVPVPSSRTQLRVVARCPTGSFGAKRAGLLPARLGRVADTAGRHQTAAVPGRLTGPHRSRQRTVAGSPTSPSTTSNVASTDVTST